MPPFRPSLSRFLPVLLIACCLAAVPARAQETRLPNPALREAPALRFEHLSLEDGMAQGSGNTIMQDREGFLWIATQGGLHRYDGHSFKVYANTPFDTTSLSASWVWGVTEAANGDLWVGTEGGGLNRMDRATGRFTHYRHDPADATSLSSDRAFYALEDRRGDLWVATLDAGLDRMRAGEDGRFSHFRHDPGDPASLSSDVLFWLEEGPDGDLWVSSANGLNRIDPETETITRYLYDPSVDPGYRAPQNVISTWFPPDTPGVVWLATGNGLVRLHTDTGAHERFLLAPDGAPENLIHQVVPDPSAPGILWVAGPGPGLARFDVQAEAFTSYRRDPRDPHSLADNNVQSLLLDRSGTMWVGYNGAGLSAFNPGAVNFAHLRHDPDDPASLSPGTVWGIYEDRTGTLWVNTANGVRSWLTRFDVATGEVTRYTNDPSDPGTLLRGNSWAFAEDAAGHLWVAGNGAGGLNRLDRTTGRVTRFRPEGRRIGGVRLVGSRTHPGVLWVGHGGGLDRFDIATGRFTPVSFHPGDDSGDPTVLSVYEGPDGIVWGGTVKGLVRVDPSAGPGNETVTWAADYDPRDTTSISDPRVQNIVMRPEEPGILWLGTFNGGLNRFDTRTGKATHYLKEDGLADNVIYGILVDDEGTLWISTNGGISNFDPDTGTFRNYGLDDGLMALEYNQNAYAKGRDGTLYFGSGSGVTAFSPERLRTNAIPPQVALEDFKLFNESVPVGPDSPLHAPLSETKTITLRHDQNEVTFDYVALHFANPKKNTYAYRLEGYDPDWVEAGTHRSATYTNLPPGDYTFRVKAANADGVWNEAGVSVGLVVTPPWWRTWWAYLLYGIVFAGGVFGVDRIQRRRLRKKEAERAQIREAKIRAEAQQKRREDAERLSEIGRAITSTLSIREIIDTVYEHVNALMDASVFGIGIYNEKRGRIDFPASKEQGETLRPFFYRLDDPDRLAARCFNQRQEIIINDYETEYRQYVSRDLPPVEGGSPKSVLYLPLIHQGKVVGVITAQSFEKGAYSDYHVSILRTLATYAAIALDNAAAYRTLNATVEELKTMQAQLVQQEKLASLGQLTAGIAHEIKNPLNFINNFAEVNEELADELRDELAPHPEILADVEDLLDDLRKNAAVIATHGKRADAIVQSMMAHARGGESRRETVDVNAYVDEYLGLAYHGQRARVPDFNAEIIRDFDEAAGRLELMPQEIGRVLLNLLGNAFDALHEHTSKHPGTYAPKLTVTTRRENGHVAIHVADNGPGIPDEVRAHIFEPFFTTKPTGSGTGLGLSLSHDIVTQGHGGTLTVESTPGAGATFVVTLPA
ncbi:MAG: GAF domain-containing protein [Bacteroidetes bacterium]|nr:MAG: GAF domain-containing protein [Bacteroidota bacterium]